MRVYVERILLQCSQGKYGDGLAFETDGVMLLDVFVIAQHLAFDLIKQFSLMTLYGSCTPGVRFWYLSCSKDVVFGERGIQINLYVGKVSNFKL